MKQEEKNKKSREAILAAAEEEFAQNGYAQSSVNAICARGGIPKGLLYYYYKDKDALYLLCAERCFLNLAHYLQELLASQPITPEAYFQARLDYFRANEMQQRLFCDAVINPAEHLVAALRERKRVLDELNAQLLTQILQGHELADGLTLADAVSQLRLFADFLNANLRALGAFSLSPEKYNHLCEQAVHTMLYGLIARKED